MRWQFEVEAPVGIGKQRSYDREWLLSVVRWHHRCRTADAGRRDFDQNPAAAAAFDRLKTVGTAELSGKSKSLESLAGNVRSASVPYGTNDTSVAGLIQILAGGLSGHHTPGAPGK